MNSKDCRKLAALELAARQVGDDATSDTHDVVRVCTEVVVPCSGSSPHFVVLQQVRIYEHTKLSVVTKGRHAAVVFGNPSDYNPLLSGI